MMHDKNSQRRTSSRKGGQAVPAGNLPASLRRVNLNAAGLDVGATQHYVAVPEGRDKDTVHCFGTFTADLIALADWLEACGVDTVAMESTGVYWIPVFEMLEQRGFTVKLVEPGRLKSVPGRKTDVLDCQWIQQLHTFGLLQGSFRPEEDICVLRSYMRQRGMLVAHASQHILHMQKALMQMNVRLHHVISDITGATGVRILDAILAGNHDRQSLAKLRDERCKNDEATVALALQGNWRDEHLFALKQAVDLYRFYQRQLAEVDEQLQRSLQTFADRSEGKTVPTPKKRKAGSNAPDFNTRQLLLRMTGVDLTTIDGIQGHSALELVSEIGTDMSLWPTEKHFASWLCLCPGNKKTGGRTVTGKSRRSANRAAATLRMAAQSLSRSQCALGGFLSSHASAARRPKGHHRHGP